MPEFITYVIDKTHPEFIRAVAENKVIQIVINIVMAPLVATSDKDDEDQEYFEVFARDNIRKKEGASIKKTNLIESFKRWYDTKYYKQNMPKGKKITELMNKHFSLYNKGWNDIELISYNKHQEYFESFVRENIHEKEGATISETDLLESFKCWYRCNYGRRIPKGNYITDLMNHRFGIFDKGWHNIELFMEEEDDAIDI